MAMPLVSFPKVEQMAYWLAEGSSEMIRLPPGASGIGWQWLEPLQVLDGRLMKLGLQLEF